MLPDNNPENEDLEKEPPENQSTATGADEFMQEFRGALQDKGIYTSSKKTGPTSWKMNVTISRDAERTILTKRLETDFNALQEATTKAHKEITRSQITFLIGKLEELGDDVQNYRDRLMKGE